jgi:outer membrane lipoprotein
VRTQLAIRILSLGLLGAALSGCASYPISQGLRQQAQPLEVNQVIANPNAYRGAVVIWGGRIIQTINFTNGASVYVLDFPLDKGGMPKRYTASPGRFIARSASFLDPEVFRSGRLVTVAGTVAGVMTEPVQNIQFTYPIIDVREIHIWLPAPPPAYPPGWNGGWYGPGWDWGWYGPGFVGGFYGPIDVDRDRGGHRR